MKKKHVKERIKKITLRTQKLYMKENEWDLNHEEEKTRIKKKYKVKMD